jgi:hypothetical protein
VYNHLRKGFAQCSTSLAWKTGKVPSREDSKYSETDGHASFITISESGNYRLYSPCMMGDGSLQSLKGF